MILVSFKKKKILVNENLKHIKKGIIEPYLFNLDLKLSFNICPTFKWLRKLQCKFGISEIDPDASSWMSSNF